MIGTKDEAFDYRTASEKEADKKPGDDPDPDEKGNRPKAGLSLQGVKEVHACLLMVRTKSATSLVSVLGPTAGGFGDSYSN